MIDWTRAMELRDEVGAEDFDEVVDLFLSEVEDCLARLDANNPTAQMEADMHYLKGSALNLGFSEFAKLCQEGETTPATVDVTAVKALFAHSKDAFVAALPLNTAPGVK